MKLLFLKYLCLPVICFASGYSYLFLCHQSSVLHESISKNTPKEKRVVIHDKKNNSTKVVIIAPPKDTTKEKEENEFAPKDKNTLPDVEFLKFLINKSTEGIPVLKFNGFFAAL